jgi:hypothetical protein
MALKKRKVPAGPTDVAPGNSKRFAPSSSKQPKPTGLDPGNPSYGIKGGGGQKNPVGRMNSMFGTGSRNLPSGQGNLESKAKRQVC